MEMETMKLYQLHSPTNSSYAQAIRLGTWYPLGTKVCPECGSSQQKRISPLIIEWEPGTDEIGDFTLTGFDSDMVVVDRVKKALEEQFSGIKYGPVEYHQNPRLTKPKNITRRTKPRVWLPYTGPELWDVNPTHYCKLNHSKSNIAIEKVCSTCGRIFYKTHSFQQKYLVLDITTWNSEQIFRVEEYPGAIFCTEYAKEFIEKANYSNVRFLDVGLMTS